MPDLVSLIVNPAAGGGRSLRLLPAVTAELDGLGVRYAVDAVALAGRRPAARGRGGGRPGTWWWRSAGTAWRARWPGWRRRGGATFGIVPAGRGNDLAGVLGIPSGPAAAARVLAGGHVRAVDLIGVSVPGQPECVVAGSVYAGIPSVASEIANAMRWRLGPAVYPVAALRALAGWRPVSFRLEPGDGAVAARAAGCGSSPATRWSSPTRPGSARACRSLPRP